MLVELTVLAVPDCPNAPVLKERLAAATAGRSDVSVLKRLIRDTDEAARLGMRGSPTLLVNGTDPFPAGGDAPGISCRVYRDEHGHPVAVPSVAALTRVIEEVRSG